jgi:hypothetical protein
VKQKRVRAGTVYEAVREQYRETWGQPAMRTQLDVDGAAVAVYKWAADSNAHGVAMYATVGASDRPVPGRAEDDRVEFYVGLVPEHDEVCDALAALTSHAEREGVTLDHGQAVTVNRPLWPGTHMQSFLVVRPTPPMLPPIALRHGPRIEFLQAVPLNHNQGEFKSEHGTDALLDLWKQAGVPYWDRHKSPGPG